MVANGTTNAHGPWTTLAILEPSKPEYDKNGGLVQWKVQRNAEGTWRCNCKGFIFSGKGGVVRDCKHIRKYQIVVAAEVTPVVTPAAMPMSTQHPQWDSAYAICSAMVDQARLIVNDKQRTQMVDVLAKKLAAFVPTKPVIRPTQAVVAGVRHITFDD